MEKNTAEATATLVDGLPPGDQPAEPIQVELDEEAQPQPQERKVEDKTKEPRKTGRAELRIQALARERDGFMSELEQERRRSAELADALKQRDAELNAGQQRQMELHKARLQAESQRAAQMLREARGAQDIDKETEAQRLLSRSESGLADVEAWEARHKAEPAKEEKEPPARETEQPRQPQAPQLDPATAGWMSENPWFTPVLNGKPNPEFDRVMHLHAVAYAAELEQKLMAEGKTSEIAGPGYWDQINTFMSKKFPDRYETAEEEKPAQAPARQQTTTVAPATRSQPSLSQPAKGGKVIAELSGAERGMADSLRSSGALKYPMNHPNTALRGQRMSVQDSYVEYAKRIRDDRAQQEQRRANQ